MEFVFLFSRWLCLPLHYTRVLSTWGRYHFAVLLKSSEPATTGNTPRSVLALGRQEEADARRRRILSNPSLDAKKLSP